jgi:hypothetical protein
MVTQIAMANDEQAKGVAGVNQTVVEMDRNTQQNAALSSRPALRRCRCNVSPNGSWPRLPYSRHEARRSSQFNFT